MLLLLMLPVVFVVAHVYAYLQLYAPSNVLIAHVRSAPPRLRTAVALLLLAATLLVAMHLVAEAVASGAPGWLNLVVLILAWDAIKVGALSVHVALRWMWSMCSNGVQQARRRQASEWKPPRSSPAQCRIAAWRPSRGRRCSCSTCRSTS